MENKYQDKWNESYSRKENYIFFPKEEVVKFLNRFVRRKIGVQEFKDILDFSKPVRALDFGCGIGRQAILLSEFGMESYGVDISSEAIKVAQNNARLSGQSSLAENLKVYDGQKLPFENNFFDVAIAESVLDSMHFSLALKIMSELNRVCKKYLFISLISGDNNQYPREFDGEELVNTQHEEGTIQSYFNYTKIQKLIEHTDFEITYCNLIQEQSVINNFKNGRYSIILKKK